MNVLLDFLKKISSVLIELKVPWSNCVGISVGNTSENWGKRNLIMLSLLCVTVIRYKTTHMQLLLSSHQKCAIKKGVLKNFAKFAGNICVSLFFNKVAGLRPASLLKKESLAQEFSCEFCEIFKNHFFTKHLRWLLFGSVTFSDVVNLEIK